MNISKDNKGASLIELIIALAISSIIILMILFLINNASKSFRKTNNDVNLQIEAQTILNQLSNLAMEATDMEAYLDISYEKRFIFKYKDDEYYTIIHKDTYLYQVATDDPEQAKLPSLYNKEQHLLAEYVQDLNITPNEKSVTIYLKLSLGDDTERISKRISKRVKFRNER